MISLLPRNELHFALMLFSAILCGVIAWRKGLNVELAIVLGFFGNIVALILYATYLTPRTSTRRRR